MKTEVDPIRREILFLRGVVGLLLFWSFFSLVFYFLLLRDLRQQVDSLQSREVRRPMTEVQDPTLLSHERSAANHAPL